MVPAAIGLSSSASWSSRTTTSTGVRADGRRHRPDGPGGPGPAHLGRLRDRRHPARPETVPGAGAARHRGPRPRRHRSASTRPARSPRAAWTSPSCGTAGDDDERRIRDGPAALGESDPRPNASLQAIIDAYPDSDDWAAPSRARSPPPASTAARPSARARARRGCSAPPTCCCPARGPGPAETERAQRAGLRVLLLARSDGPVDDPDAAPAR